MMRAISGVVPALLQMDSAAFAAFVNSEIDEALARELRSGYRPRIDTPSMGYRASDAQLSPAVELALRKSWQVCSAPVSGSAGSFPRL